MCNGEDEVEEAVDEACYDPEGNEVACEDYPEDEACYDAEGNEVACEDYPEDEACYDAEGNEVAWHQRSSSVTLE